MPRNAVEVDFQLVKQSSFTNELVTQDSNSTSRNGSELGQENSGKE